MPGREIYNEEVTKKIKETINKLIHMTANDVVIWHKISEEDAFPIKYQQDKVIVSKEKDGKILFIADGRELKNVVDTVYPLRRMLPALFCVIVENEKRNRVPNDIQELFNHVLREEAEKEKEFREKFKKESKPKSFLIHIFKRNKDV